jgi:hypothetical protein
MDVLEGVRAKLGRADSKLQTLHSEIRAFQDRRSYCVKGEFDAQRSGYSFRLHITEWPPITWGVDIGEIVHNARSALDNLVWQLVILNGKEPEKWNSFPIFDDKPKKGFARVVRGTSDKPGCLAGVHKDAVTIIESAQPYHGGLANGLTALDALWNMDKHRFLMPTFITIIDPELIGPIYRANEDAEIVGEPVYPDVGWQKDGAELVFIPLAVTGPNPQMYMEGDLPIDISFGAGGAVIDVLTGAIFFISTDVLAPLQELFP